MKTHQLIHVLTLVFLIVVACLNIVGTMRFFSEGYGEMKFTPFFGTALWLFLLWKIWTRPRKWSLGVGIFLFFMVGFQTYLRQQALARPDVDFHASGYTTASFLRAELPILAAGMGCLLLSLYYPKEPNTP